MEKYLIIVDHFSYEIKYTHASFMLYALRIVVCRVRFKDNTWLFIFIHEKNTAKVSLVWSFSYITTLINENEKQCWPVQRWLAATTSILIHPRYSFFLKKCSLNYTCCDFEILLVSFGHPSNIICLEVLYIDMLMFHTTRK